MTAACCCDTIVAGLTALATKPSHCGCWSWRVDHTTAYQPSNHTMACTHASCCGKTQLPYPHGVGTPAHYHVHTCTCAIHQQHVHVCTAPCWGCPLHASHPAMSSEAPAYPGLACSAPAFPVACPGPTERRCPAALLCTTCGSIVEAPAAAATPEAFGCCYCSMATLPLRLTQPPTAPPAAAVSAAAQVGCPQGCPRTLLWLLSDTCGSHYLGLKGIAVKVSFHLQAHIRRCEAPFMCP